MSERSVIVLMSHRHKLLDTILYSYFPNSLLFDFWYSFAFMYCEDVKL
jgi:hypothetical protein